MKNINHIFKKFIPVIIIAFSFSSCNSGKKSIDSVSLIPVKSGKEFQYVDLEGQIVINPQFTEASIFRDGLALVETSGEKPRWGFIGEDGKYVIAANFLSATVFGDGLAWVVSENGAPTCINTKGEVLFALQNAEEVQLFSDGLAGFKEVNNEGQEKWGFVDKEGKAIINAQFSEIGNFVNGMCPVSNPEGKWGYIDKEGKILINYQFDDAKSFYGGFAVVVSDGKAGLIDEKGKYKINPQFSEIQNDGDLFLVQQDGKFGWTDKEGKIIINPQFSRAYPFNNQNLAAVQSGKSFGFIDKEGKVVINPQFDMALPFNGKLALVLSSNKIGFIDEEGKYVINPQFDGVSDDLVEYFQSGGSSFSSIKSDFFDVGAIISRLKIDSPEGISFNSLLSDIITKFKKSQSDLSQYGVEHQLISNEKINNNVLVDFYILCSAWINNGYYGSSTFNSNAKPSAFMYKLNLTGKANGKEDAIKSAIETSLSGYTKDVTISNERESIFKNTKQSVKVFTQYGNIIIIISPLSSQSDFSLPNEESAPIDSASAEYSGESPYNE